MVNDATNPQSEAGHEAQATAAPVPARQRRRARKDVLRGNRLTLAQLVTSREPNLAGAIFLLAYITAWGVHVETHEGQWPRSTRHLAQSGDIPERTLHRWAERFQAVFPEYDSPKELWMAIRDQVGAVQGLDPIALALSIGAAELR
jgi:hypothetical protein